MDYKEPALIGFVQAAIDYLNYSKGNGEKADLGSLTSADINFLKDNLGLNFENDAAAILRGHQAFRDIIYKRQHDRDAFDKSYYSNTKENDIPDNPYYLFKEQTPESYFKENKASSKESAEAIDNLFGQIESNSKPEKEVKVAEQNETINIARDTKDANVIKETINKIKSTAGREARIINNEDEDPVFEYAEKENYYYKYLKNISKAYKDLSIDFIKDVLSNKDEIDLEYPINIPLIVLHRISFKDVDELRKFTEIMINHQYFANVDERKGIVDVFKQVVNTSGKIITVICDVANQAAHVHGNYEGYKVLKAE